MHFYSFLSFVVLFLSSVYGQNQYLRPDRSISTNRFGSCMKNSAIRLDEFNAAYFDRNLSIVFNIRGQSNLSQKLQVSLQVYAYGSTRLNYTFDPCQTNLPGLCPLQAGIPFQAAGAIPITPQVAANIPSIAYNIPDFDGQAFLRFYSYTTGEQVGCATATVINGKTFKHGYVSIITGCLALFAALCSFASIISFSSRPTDGQAVASHSAPSVFTVFSFFQFIAMSAAVSVTYPVIFVSWAANFSWSLGLLPLKSFERSINRFRTATKGVISNVLPGGIRKREITALVTPTPPGYPQPGVYQGFQGLCTRTGLTTTNAFMTSLFWFLIVFASILFFLVLFKVSVEIFCRAAKTRRERMLGFRRNWVMFMAVTFMRVLFVAFFALTFLSLYQFTLADAYGPKIIAGIVLFMTISLLFGSALYVTIQGVRDQASLFMHPQRLSRWGWLYVEYSPNWWFWFIPLLTYDLCKAVVLALAQGHGKIQSMILVVIEIIAFVAILVARPYGAARGNFANILMALVRVIVTGIIVVFAFDIGGIIRTILGIVIIAIEAICAIGLVGMIAWNGFVALLLLAPSRKTPRVLRKQQSMYREQVLAHPELANEKYIIDEPSLGNPNGFGMKRSPLEGPSVEQFDYYPPGVRSPSSAGFAAPVLFPTHAYRGSSLSIPNSYGAGGDADHMHPPIGGMQRPYNDSQEHFNRGGHWRM